MSDLTQNPLPLQPFSEDDRPLPEIIADGNPDPDTGWPAFPLAWHNVEGVHYYAIQDWIRGVAQTADMRQFWDAMKRRLKKTGVEVSTWCLQLPYRAANRKTYQVDYTNAEGLYRITQRMGVNTGLSQRILEFLSASGVMVDGQRIDAIHAAAEIDAPTAIDPEKMIQSVITAYERMGKSDQWIAARLQSTVQRKRFTKAFQHSLRVNPSAPQFADITNTMRKGLWKRSTQEIRAELGLHSKANLRDSLSTLGLLYEAVAEEVSAINLSAQENLEYEQTRRIVRSDAERVGKQAESTGKHLGMDIPTGKPLLRDGKKPRNRDLSE